MATRQSVPTSRRYRAQGRCPPCPDRPKPPARNKPVSSAPAFPERHGSRPPPDLRERRRPPAHRPCAGAEAPALVGGPPARLSAPPLRFRFRERIRFRFRRKLPQARDRVREEAAGAARSCSDARQPRRRGAGVRAEPDRGGGGGAGTEQSAHRARLRGPAVRRVQPSASARSGSPPGASPGPALREAGPVSASPAGRLKELGWRKAWTARSASAPAPAPEEDDESARPAPGGASWPLFIKPRGSRLCCVSERDWEAKRRELVRRAIETTHGNLPGGTGSSGGTGLLTQGIVSSAGQQR